MTKEQAKELMAKLEKKGLVTLTKKRGTYCREAKVQEMEKSGVTFKEFIEACHVMGEL